MTGSATQTTPEADTSPKKTTPDYDIVCPFCGEDDYDKAGLRHHLKNYCEEFNSVEY